MIELVGDVGSGKTTLTQGLIAGLGFEGDVISPTFTVGRVYPAADGRQIHHFDFYRLHGHDVVTEELAEALNDPEAIAITEWSGQGAASLPPRRLRLSLAARAAELERVITVESLDPALDYIVEGLRHAYCT